MRMTANAARSEFDFGVLYYLPGPTNARPG